MVTGGAGGDGAATATGLVVAIPPAHWPTQPGVVAVTVAVLASDPVPLTVPWIVNVADPFGTNMTVPVIPEGGSVAVHAFGPVAAHATEIFVTSAGSWSEIDAEPGPVPTLRTVIV